MESLRLLSGIYTPNLIHLELDDNHVCFTSVSEFWQTPAKARGTLFSGKFQTEGEKKNNNEEQNDLSVERGILEKCHAA